MAPCVLSCSQLCIHNTRQEKVDETAGKVLQGCPPAYQHPHKRPIFPEGTFPALPMKIGAQLSDDISRFISLTKSGARESSQPALSVLLWCRFRRHMPRLNSCWQRQKQWMSWKLSWRQTWTLEAYQHRRHCISHESIPCAKAAVQRTECL